MSPIINNAISHLRLIQFYRGIFSIKNLLKECLNIVIRGHSFFPLTVNMLVTSKCSLLCKMCAWGDFYDSQSENIRKEELNIDDIYKFIDQIKLYQPVIHFGGGEPFMRSDLKDIINIVKTNSLKCLITTNGLFMDGDTIDKILKLKIDVLIFSLYGWQDIHDTITGVKGSFEKTLANLKYVLEKKTGSTRVFVSVLPLPENIRTLKWLIKNIHALGVDGVKIEQLNFLVSGEYNFSSEIRNGFNLNPATLIREGHFDKEFTKDLLDTYRDISNNYKGFVFTKPHLTKSQMEEWYLLLPLRQRKCFFITHSVFINYNGDVIPCQFFLRCVLGNIKNESLKNIWSSDTYRTLRRTINDIRPSVCARCCKN